MEPHRLSRSPRLVALDATRVADLAATLGDALPRIQHLVGKTLVIKYGGNAMVGDASSAEFSRDIVLLRHLGIYPIVVHGGGPQIDRWLARVGKRTEFIDGMRVTDDETMEIVEMVLGGLVNQEIVGLINRNGGRAVGLTGRDGGLIAARKLLVACERAKPNQNSVDLGHVGEVANVSNDVIDSLVAAGFIPVVAPIGVGEDGAVYNINADLVAGRLAESLRAEKLIFLTNTEGLLDKAGRRLGHLDEFEVERLIADGTISGGMLPKVRGMLDALRGGVGAVHVIDGRRAHCVVLEMLTSGGIGTVVTLQSSEG